MKLIIFDLDGTLVDSLPDLVRTVNAAMADYGLPGVDRTQVAPWVGRGSRVLLQHALDHHGVGTGAANFDFEAAFARFLQHYGDNLVGASALYPGTAEVLAQLQTQGYSLAVCTNKPERFVAPLLQALGVAPRFGALLGGDSLPQRKPDPEPLLHLARHFGCEPGNCLMVGDSRHDIDAARAAGMIAAGLRLGYGGDADFAASPPDVVLDSIRELPGWMADPLRSPFMNRS